LLVMRDIVLICKRQLTQIGKQLEEAEAAVLAQAQAAERARQEAQRLEEERRARKA
jgi:hypothetical protein